MTETAERIIQNHFGCSADKIFFDGAWGTALPPEKQAEIADLAEMVRWAPAA